MAEYRLTPAAERDLESIWVHTVREWGVEQAVRYIDLLTTAFSPAWLPRPGLSQPVTTFGQATAEGASSAT